MKAFWEERYGAPEYAYGTAPNRFIAEFIDQYPPGRILFPAEGEGRNAVYAAWKGWTVDAFDYSENAQTKALQLAARRNVVINYTVADIQSFNFGHDVYDVVGLCFVHLSPDLRRFLHAAVVKALKPGGKVVLEAFAKSQLLLDSGGPRQEEMLFSAQELREDWAALDIQFLQSMTTELSEGPYHQGTASVIRMIAEK